MIKISGLSKSFGNLKVLKDINLQINQEGIVAFLGPNGSGKTTLIKCFLGMVLPSYGDIIFKGASILGEFQYRDQVAHVPQIASFPTNLTPRELILMLKDIRPGQTRHEELIDLFDLKGEMNKKMSNLSGGNRQKVNLLLGLMYEAPLIILDEPSSGLDPLSLQNLKKWLRMERAKGTLIIITTHIMGFVEEVADQVIFLLDGSIYFHGDLQTLKTQEDAQGLEEAIANILRPRINQMA